MMEEAGAVGAAWSAARGWLTPAVLFVAINLVIVTIAVASRLMSSSSASAPAGGGEGDDHHHEAAGEPRAALLLRRAPSFRASFSFSRLVGLAGPLSGADDVAQDPDPSLQQQPAAEAQHQRVESRIERSRSEAAAEEAPNVRRRPRMATAEDRLGGQEADAVEVDARADDFIRRFREQLRLQRLDSLLR